jgi:predicted double-glycine peptidase
MIVGLVGKMIRSDIVSDVSNALFRHYRFKKLQHAANWITHVCKIIMPQFQKKKRNHHSTGMVMSQFAMPKRLHRRLSVTTSI